MSGCLESADPCQRVFGVNWRVREAEQGLRCGGWQDVEKPRSGAVGRNDLLPACRLHRRQEKPGQVGDAWCGSYVLPVQQRDLAARARAHVSQRGIPMHEGGHSCREAGPLDGRYATHEATAQRADPRGAVAARRDNRPDTVEELANKPSGRTYWPEPRPPSFGFALPPLVQRPEQPSRIDRVGPVAMRTGLRARATCRPG